MNPNDIDSLTEQNENLANPNNYSYRPGVYPCDFHNILPDFIIDNLKEGLLEFDKKMPGFSKNAILIGPETRSSAPLRIERDKQSGEASIKGIFPAGEGAGYAGGISSAAVDGIKQAKAMLAIRREAIKSKRS